MTQQHAASATRHRRPLVWLVAAAVGLACAAAGFAFILFAPLPGATTEASAETLGRGIIDYRLEQASVDPAAVPAIVAEMGPDKLRASWTRVLVHWNALQPAAPDPAAETPYARGLRDPTGRRRRRAARRRRQDDLHHGRRARMGQRPRRLAVAPPGLCQGFLSAVLRPGHGEPRGPGRLQGRRRIPCVALRGQSEPFRVLERAQPGQLLVPAGPRERQERRRGHVPPHAQGVVRRSEERQPRRRSHRGSHSAARAGRRGEHSAAGLRAVPRGPRRSRPHGRVFAPPVHARRVHPHCAGRAAQQPR